MTFPNTFARGFFLGVVFFFITIWGRDIKGVCFSAWLNLRAPVYFTTACHQHQNNANTKHTHCAFLSLSHSLLGSCPTAPPLPIQRPSRPRADTCPTRPMASSPIVTRRPCVCAANPCHHAERRGTTDDSIRPREICFYPTRRSRPFHAPAPSNTIPLLPDYWFPDSDPSTSSAPHQTFSFVPPNTKLPPT